MMVLEDAFPEFARSGAAPFPAYGAPTPGVELVQVEFINPATVRFRPSDAGPLDKFRIVALRHSTFDAEWPIQIDIPIALRGFRNALGLSQAKFAEALRERRLNIERWETGKSRPFRGHVLPLLNLLRPAVDGPLVAGQLLNLVAAVVCPHLTRPAAIYSQREIAEPLADKRGEHLDLVPALVAALVASEILIPLDPIEEGPNAKYVPLAGVGTIDRAVEPWESELQAVARRLDPDDRKLWLAVGKRLASRQLK